MAKSTPTGTLVKSDSNFGSGWDIYEQEDGSFDLWEYFQGQTVDHFVGNYLFIYEALVKAETLT